MSLTYQAIWPIPYYIIVDRYIHADTTQTYIFNLDKINKQVTLYVHTLFGILEEREGISYAQKLMLSTGRDLYLATKLENF